MHKGYAKIANRIASSLVDDAVNTWNMMLVDGEIDVEDVNHMVQIFREYGADRMEYEQDKRRVRNDFKRWKQGDFAEAADRLNLLVKKFSYR